MTAGNISILILAAGASSRMRGRDKLLESVAGKPLLRHVVEMAQHPGLNVTVALPAQRPDRTAALAGLVVRRLYIPNVEEGMALSLRLGVAALPPDHACLIMLADMPELDSADIAQMIAAYRLAPDMIHRATDPLGKVGHPVIFPPWARADLLALKGDGGAKPLFLGHKDKLVFVALPMGHATTDLDTPEDWATWRKKTTP